MGGIHAQVDHYTFRGDFDSGNLKSVQRVPGPDGAASVYEVWILKDCEGAFPAFTGRRRRDSLTGLDGRDGG